MNDPATPVKLDDVIARLPAKRRKAVERRATDLVAEEMSLRELRRSLELTQADVASALDKGQHEISRIEQRGDMLLSTLARLVQAMGGELELVCRFGNRAPVRLVPPRHPARIGPDAASSRRRPKGVVR